MRQQSTVDLHLLCWKQDRVLLQLRQNTGYCDGNFHLPAGHLEAGESVITGMRREAKEELGIEVQESDLTLTFTLHQNSAGSRIGLFFGASTWSGTPAITELDKCAALEWFSLQSLPENLVPYAAFALREIAVGKRLGLYGWNN